MTTKSTESQTVGLINIDYNRNLIMSIEDAMKFMEIVSRSELMKGYASNYSFEDFDSEIKLSIISAKEIKERKLASMLDNNESK